ncbi:hypothetical protein J8273_6128 [Carpediemonas membranifera]|uniref:Uncharacterized protein n=1 Tax=Carpediemonas membranifera TaxID=201153 RepID=A0A8J6DY20_9EUKA|nr:hypothetical protein J8273_6128 [Carpediemonas membranifera]|eukprot:KAG9391374.1 hypothetical protein J8273_6128 [Carpediemonas membranifera]
MACLQTRQPTSRQQRAGVGHFRQEAARSQARWSRSVPAVQGQDQVPHASFPHEILHTAWLEPAPRDEGLQVPHQTGGLQGPRTAQRYPSHSTCR